jgi:hypothetical protein
MTEGSVGACDHLHQFETMLGCQGKAETGSLSNRCGNTMPEEGMHA